MIILIEQLMSIGVKTHSRDGGSVKIEVFCEIVWGCGMLELKTK